MVSGRTLRMLRESRGMTQWEMARLIDVSQSYVALVERGQRIPSRTRLARWLAVFGLTINDFNEKELA